MLLWNAVSKAVLRRAWSLKSSDWQKNPDLMEENGKALQLFPASKFIHPIETNSSIFVQAPRDRKRRLQRFEN
jgi:hypothetical protein